MIKTVIIGQGLVATHFAVGLEKLKNNEIEDYGIPLRNFINYKYNDIEIVASYDVDENKVGKTIYDIAKTVFPNDTIPSSLKDIVVNRGIHLSSLDNLPFKAMGREEKIGLKK
ncbi:MAG: myo-inositol-1-phosphate synthase, partial [Desulfurococcaceae archaeon]